MPAMPEKFPAKGVPFSLVGSPYIGNACRARYLSLQVEGVYMFLNLPDAVLIPGCLDNFNK